LLQGSSFHAKTGASATTKRIQTRDRKRATSFYKRQKIEELPDWISICGNSHKIWADADAKAREEMRAIEYDPANPNIDSKFLRWMQGNF